MLHDTEHSEEAEHSNLYHSNITIKKNETKYSKTIIKKIDKILFDYSESDDDFVQIILPTTVQVP